MSNSANLKNPFCEMPNCDGIMDRCYEKECWICRKCKAEFKCILVSEGKNADEALDAMVCLDGMLHGGPITRAALCRDVEEKGKED